VQITVILIIPGKSLRVKVASLNNDHPLSQKIENCYESENENLNRIERNKSKMGFEYK